MRFRTTTSIPSNGWKLPGGPQAGPMHIRMNRDFAKMQDTPAFHALKKRTDLDF